MWRVMYRELRALTNDKNLALNPMDLNDLYEEVWNVGALLQTDEWPAVLDDGFRPWPRVKEGTEASWDFYDIHDRNKAADLLILRKYQEREDVDTYTVVLKEIFHLFGQAIHESLTRTMGLYLEATSGVQQNKNKSPWEIAIASRMLCTNNAAESPFGTAKAYLDQYPSMKLNTLAAFAGSICSGTHRPKHGIGKHAKEAGIALTAPEPVKRAVSKLCGVRRRNPGALTVLMRANNVADVVEANLERIQRKAKKMAAKAKAQSKKMNKIDAAIEANLADSNADLNDELESFGRAKTARLKYLQEQFQSRKLLRNGVYLSIPAESPFRAKHKPYPLRMKPLTDSAKKATTTECINYLTKLVRVMITEDQARPLEPGATLANTNILRRLPIVSVVYVNPVSIRLKAEQEARVALLAAPTDNPWLTKLHAEYVGKILYDNGYFCVFDVLYVANKGSKTRYPCWEATTEPGYIEDGQFCVDERHLTTGTDGKKIVLKSSMVGFALAEYSNGDDVDPVRLPFADECLSRCIQRQAREASATANGPPKRRKRAHPSSASATTRRSSRFR
jgi:hypothetical protein